LHASIEGPVHAVNYSYEANRDLMSSIDNKATDLSGSCHLFRHSGATHVLENGADIRLIQQFFGHARLDTRQIYTEVAINALREVHTRTHPTARVE
jgi:integrase/recombinase XerD